MESYKPYFDLFASLDESSLVITVNKRLSQHLLAGYLKYLRHKRGSSIIMRSAVLSLNDWIERLYHDACQYGEELADVIDDSEVEILFSEIVIKRHEHLSASSCSRELVSAWQRLNQWQIELSELVAWLDNKNTAFFYDCALEFERLCREKHWIDSSRLINELMALNQRCYPSLKGIEKVYFVGFDIKSPALCQWIARLEMIGITVSDWSLNTVAAKVDVVTCDSEADEIKYAAQMAASLTAIDKKARVGIVVLDMQSSFALLRRLLDAELVNEQHRLSGDIDNQVRPYTISAGQPLSEIPIIAQLIKWLNLFQAGDWESITTALNSPFIAGVKTHGRNRQAQLYALKKQVPLKVSWQVLSPLLALYLQEDEPLLISIEAISSLWEMAHKPISAMTFIERIKSALTALGWPGEIPLSSSEHQATASFYSCFNTLLLSQRLGRQYTLRQWLYRLQQLLQQELFQPESNAEAQIHVLGMLECSEIFFDRLFVLGMTDELWPATTKAHPLLPYQLQKQYDMPHVNNDRELLFAKAVSERLLHQAERLTISYSGFSENGENRVSPLFDHFPVQPAVINRGENGAAVMFETQPDYMPALNMEAISSVKGGVQILKNMADCPYRAALIHRLDLEGYPEHLLALEAVEKGIIIHAVLERVWRELRTQQRLLELDDDALQVIIQGALNQALQVYPGGYRFVPAFIKKLELMRLQQLVLKWLQYEKSRHEGFDIIALEKRIELKLAGVALTLRIDRIDRLDRGAVVIIDYKTGQNFSIKKLLEDPIGEPQLPLYAIYEEADAVAVAVVHGRNIKFETVSGIENWLTESLPVTYGDKKGQLQNFDELRDFWRQNLSRTMERFIAGDITLTPSPQHCQFCRFGAICRHSVV
ncbi:MAG: PD-(D/E)XK nuclease family protein [Francisellaceae bacterium]